MALQEKLNWCAGCIHYKPCPWYDNGYACLYILDTKCSRGCDAGYGCHHYETSRNQAPGEAYKKQLRRFYELERARGDGE